MLRTNCWAVNCWPLHRGTFNLAFHAWRQPVQRLLEAAASGVALLLPAPSQRVHVAAGPLNSRWRARSRRWQEIPAKILLWARGIDNSVWLS